MIIVDEIFSKKRVKRNLKILLMDQYSIRPLVTKNVDVVPIRQRRNSDTDFIGSSNSNGDHFVLSAQIQINTVKIGDTYKLLVPNVPKDALKPIKKINEENLQKKIDMLMDKLYSLKAKKPEFFLLGGGEGAERIHTIRKFNKLESNSKKYVQTRQHTSLNVTSETYEKET
ncbi:hypothetical protein H8356DRAFT_1358049 [Neocallimastix lanati (nom. inval.)]|nr:hypothetical protein H8356DRAFT_1358049 [Neocallimastix sp. JGI-2020a]